MYSAYTYIVYTLSVFRKQKYVYVTTADSESHVLTTQIEVMR